MTRILQLFSLLLIASLSSSCGPKKDRIIFDEAANQDILYGYVTVDAFTNYRFNDWFAGEYNAYVPQKDILDSLQPVIANVTITLVMGTWCSDSRREVPRFLKILDELKYSMKNLKIIGVDRLKACPECGVNEGYIDFVPTFIISRDNHEIGRIVESPNNSLEEDFYLIVK